MKKILVIASFLVCSLGAFAYSDYYGYSHESNGWVIFMSFIFIVWGILNIILFFKIWKMTNNVKDIRDEIKEEPEIDPVITELFILHSRGDDEVTYNYLVETTEKEFANKMSSFLYDDMVSGKAKKSFKKMKADYASYFKIINKEMPEYLSSMQYDSLDQFIYALQDIRNNKQKTQSNNASL